MNLKRPGLITIILILLLSVNLQADGGGFRIFAVNYGHSPFRNRFLFYHDRSGNTTSISWMFYYLEYNGRRILIDTGFNNPKMVKMFGIESYRNPLLILKENGIEADSITDVIITHSHFDHIGNAPKFRNARFIINREALASLERDKNQKDIRSFIKNHKNIEVFDNETILYNMFRIKKIGGHTRGSSVVFFSNGGDKYCFTGDEVYLNENVTNGIGNGSVSDHKKNIEFIKLLKESGYRLFISHDSRYSGSLKNFIRVFHSD